MCTGIWWTFTETTEFKWNGPKTDHNIRSIKSSLLNCSPLKKKKTCAEKFVGVFTQNDKNIVVVRKFLADRYFPKIWETSPANYVADNVIVGLFCSWVTWMVSSIKTPLRRVMCRSICPIVSVWPDGFVQNMTKWAQSVAEHWIHFNFFAKLEKE